MIGCLAEETAEQKLKRYEFVIEAYVTELTRLRDENARLVAQADAHSVLRSIYLDPEAPQGNRIKAAGLALQHEVPRLLPERQALELKAEGPEMTLGERHQWALERQLRLEAEHRDIEVSDTGDVRILPKPNGNGSDDTAS